MNVVALFQETKRICGICPCCGEVFRLSDATIHSEGRPAQTPFDRLEARREQLDREVEKFDESERAVRQAAARQGRVEAQKQLRAIAGCFTRQKIDPHDVKVLFHPVRYIVFDGLCQERPKRIVLLDDGAAGRAGLHGSIVKTIDAGNFEWITLRIDDAGQVRRAAR